MYIFTFCFPGSLHISQIINLCPAAVSSYHSLSPILITWETTVGGGRGETWEPPKVRDETHWQAQVTELNTFGASKSHRHPVVIHQHMCWNASPSLNIVSVGARLMHGCFSLVHAEGHRWLVLQRHTHTSALMSCTYISLYLQGTCSFRRMETELLFFGPFATPQTDNNEPMSPEQHLENIPWEWEHVAVLGLLPVSMCIKAVMILCRWHVWQWIRGLSLRFLLL